MAEGERKRLSAQERRKRRVRRALRKAEKRRQRNKMYLGAMRNAIRAFRKALEQTDLATEKMWELYIQAVRRIQKAGSKGVIHKNEVARRVSRLTKKYNQWLAARRGEQAEEA